MPDYTGGGVDAGALEDSYIKLFKARDARATRIFPYAEILYNAGKLTIDDIAKFVNDILPITHRVASYFNEMFTVDFIQKVVSNPNLSADKTQAILYNLDPEKCLEVMVIGASDKTITTDTSISGVNRYKTLTVDSGVTLNVTDKTCVIMCENFDNRGTISAIGVGGAGGDPGSSPGKGGNGGGGIIILAKTIASVGTIRADGTDGESGSTSDTTASGKSGEGGLFWEVDGYPTGNGGAGGNRIDSCCATGRKNGGGGGGIACDIVGGGSREADVFVFKTPEDLLKELFKCVVDWYIQNILGKTPTTVKTIPNLYGSGGGGGGDGNGYGDCGGGGGGGGQVIIFGKEFISGGTITARGGKGGNGGSEGNDDSGGGGGGGGIIYVFYKYKLATNTFTFDVSGGAGGTGDHSGDSGSAGSAATFQV